ncbi:MAG: hypothetical protein ACI9MR_004454 [Myxococcota bacterium]
MSDRSSGGPILRKRGARKRDDGRDSGATAKPAAAAPAVPNPVPAAPAQPPEAPTPPVRRAVGRRLYDPRGDATAAAPVSPGTPVDAGTAVRPPPRRSSAPKRGRSSKYDAAKEKEALKGQAQALAKEKGIPVVHAYRILKGQVTLNDVLKAMMRKERFEKLVASEGIDRELAGQVASGHLSKKRAVVLTRMRALRNEKLHLDAIKNAELAGEQVAVDFFEHGWRTGKVQAARPYDFDFMTDGETVATTHFKHDVKALCEHSSYSAVKDIVSVEPDIRSQGLVGTEDRSTRVRPEDDRMLDLAHDERIVRFTMRDGETFLGKIKSFGRWDVELVLNGGETLTVFFHGLHPISLRLGLNA